VANPFVLPVDEYGRDYNIVQGALEDAAHYLSRNTGDSYETCLAYAKKALTPGGVMGMIDPKVKMLHRDNSSDRERGVTTFTQYLKHVQDHNLLMAPTMTVYDREENNPSILSAYTGDRIEERKVYKRRKFEAGQRGDELAKSIADSQQSSCKTDANSLSGAHNSEYSILFVKSAHSTLTSTCRSATAYANGNNEKFIQGSRHYWEPDTVYTNIAAICNMADLPRVDEVVRRYGLVYPTPDQVMDCIVRSTRLYWSSDKHMKQIRHYVIGLTDVERAAFMYVGDLYHLAILNPEMVRELFDRFIQPPKTPVADPDAVLADLDEDILVYLSVMMQDVFRGREFKDIAQTDPDGWSALASQVDRVRGALMHYEPLIQTLWASPVAPASVAVLPNAVRRSVIAGDTDSTIFTVQWWVEWYLGQIDFSETAYRVAATVAYFTSQMVIHLLATISGNMGISKHNLFMLSMKNEFCYPIFVPTNRSKHYFAYQLAQEGNVFRELGLELKGAELRSAQTPAEIKELEVDMIKEIMEGVMTDTVIDAKSKLYKVAQIEHQIRKDIKGSSSNWFRTRQVKSKDTYTNPYSSIWQYYEMWNEVFGPKYGMVEEPPYMAVSFKVSAKNKTEIQEWLDGIEDPDIRHRLKHWLQRRNKQQISEIMLPLPVIDRVGVPEELIQGANLAKVIYTIMSPFYIVLETLGFYYPTKPYIQLVSDEITEQDVVAYFEPPV
jgi:hypothetical protein